MIYAIRCNGTDFIKFGRAKDVGRRLVELDNANPHELSVAVVSQWHDGAETAIHRFLQAHRVKGEWFQDGPSARLVMAWMLDAERGLEQLQHASAQVARQRTKEEKEERERVALRHLNTERAPFNLNEWRADRAARKLRRAIASLGVNAK